MEKGSNGLADTVIKSLVALIGVGGAVLGWSVNNQYDELKGKIDSINVRVEETTRSNAESQKAQDEKINAMEKEASGLGAKALFNFGLIQQIDSTQREHAKLLTHLEAYVNELIEIRREERRNRELIQQQRGK